MRDGFVFYASFYEAMKKMNKQDKLAFVEAVCAYALEDETPNLSGSADLAFGLIKPQIDANIKRRVNGAKGKEFGKLGGRPTNNNPIGDNENNPIGDNSETPKEKDKVKENVYIKEKEKEYKGGVAVATPLSKKFIKPTIEDIAAYAAELSYKNFDSSSFFDFYESKGWKVGGDSMKDWKAAVRNWQRRKTHEPLAGVSRDYIMRTKLPNPDSYGESTI